MFQLTISDTFDGQFNLTVFLQLPNLSATNTILGGHCGSIFGIHWPIYQTKVCCQIAKLYIH